MIISFIAPKAVHSAVLSSLASSLFDMFRCFCLLHLFLPHRKI